MNITQNQSELIITIPKGVVSLLDIQAFLDYIRYKTLVAKSQATDADIDKLSQEINRELAKNNKLNFAL
jgi:hypothetical protein